MANLKPEVEIVNISDMIDNNISYIKENRELLSSNLLEPLRTLTEDVALLTYNRKENDSLDCHYDNKKMAINYISGYSSLRSTTKLYTYLKSAKSHYEPNGTNAERLMLKYFNYLCDIKQYVKKEFGIKILNKLYDFPLNNDKTFSNYYDKVAKKIEQVGLYGSEYIKGRYYVERVKQFRSNKKIYYEVTLTKAIDNQSKFDRIIAFTKYRILENYAAKVSFANSSINVFNGNVSIKIINNWKVNIRPCELSNLAKIFGFNYSISSKNKEYNSLMNYLTENEIDLLDIANLNDDNFNTFLEKIENKSENRNISELLINARKLLKNNSPGSNIIRYLLFTAKNKVIKSQICNTQNSLLSNLYLQYGSIPFDEMPFCMSLIDHNPDIDHLIQSIDSDNRDYEFLDRYIKINTEYENKLYTPIQELKQFGDLKTLIEKHEKKLYPKHHTSQMICEKNYVFIQEYEDTTLSILNRLIELSKFSIDGYEDEVINNLYYGEINIHQDNVDNLSILFSNSSVSIIYGSAGTGKTTFISDYCSIFSNEKIILLANTHSAVENLKRMVPKTDTFDYQVVASYVKRKNYDFNCDTLIIDESSTVENKDMLKLLEKTNFKKLLIVGDTCQIGSVKYGNWFSLACQILPEEAKISLTNARRTKNDTLLEFWQKVRDGDDGITEFLSKTEFVSSLNEGILEKFDEDEITLCLGYNGLYGINNINKYLQDINDSKAIEIGINTYKVNDPIIFEDSNKFSNTFYNNLKGKIVDINERDNEIDFTIYVEDKFDKLSAMFDGVRIVEEYENGHSLVCFTIDLFDDTDNDDTGVNDDVVPFNVSYAISIHKAQGLEYNSVKVIISNDVEDLVTKDIFYTAITRSKDKLKVYWTSETQNRIINNFMKKDINLDLKIIPSKLSI